MRPVRLGGAHRDVQLPRDLLVGVAERKQSQHFTLAVRQRVALGLGSGFSLGFNQACAQLRMHVATAASDLAHSRDQLGAGRFFKDVTTGTSGKGLAHVTRIVLHRKDQHLRIRGFLA